MSTSNELAVYGGGTIEPVIRPHAPAVHGRDDIDSWVDVMSDIVRLANTICHTEFVPKAYRDNAPAAAAAMLAGRELGLPPMTSLRHVQVVEGSPSLSAEYKRARVTASGHRIDVDELTTEKCVLTGYRSGRKPLTITYTIADARRANLVKSRGAWETRPRRMLFARASTEICDFMFPDLTNGLPTTELLEADAEDGVGGYDEHPAAAPQRVTSEQIRARRPQAATATVVAPGSSPAPATPRATAATPAPQQGAGEDLPPLPGGEEITAPVPAGKAVAEESAHAEAGGPGAAGPAGQPASTGQVGVIRRHFERLEYSDSDDDRVSRLSATAALAGYDGDLRTTSDLTAVQAARVTRALVPLLTAQDLMELLLQNGAVPGE